MNHLNLKVFEKINIALMQLSLNLLINDIGNKLTIIGTFSPSMTN